MTVRLPCRLAWAATGFVNGRMKQGVHRAPVLTVAMSFQQDVSPLSNVFSLLFVGITASQTYRLNFQRLAHTVGSLQTLRLEF